MTPYKHYHIIYSLCTTLSHFRQKKKINTLSISPKGKGIKKGSATILKKQKSEGSMFENIILDREMMSGTDCRQIIQIQAS